MTLIQKAKAELQTFERCSKATCEELIAALEAAHPSDHVMGSENALAYLGSDAVLNFLRAVESTKALQNKQVRLTLAEAESLANELRAYRVDAPPPAERKEA